MVDRWTRPRTAFDSVGGWSTYDLTNVDANAVDFSGAVFDGRYLYLLPYEHGIAVQCDVVAYPGCSQLAWTKNRDRDLRRCWNGLLGRRVRRAVRVPRPVPHASGTSLTLCSSTLELLGASARRDRERPIRRLRSSPAASSTAATSTTFLTSTRSRPRSTRRAPSSKATRGRGSISACSTPGAPPGPVAPSTSASSTSRPT